MKLRHSLAISLIVLLLITVPVVNAKTNLESNSVDTFVQIRFEDAYYADLEGDGLENDVFISSVLDFQGSNSYNFDYYIYLTLPSGLQFNYAVALSSRLQSITMSNYFWNHAIESGWYHVEIFVVLRTGGVAVTSSDIIFDPPGGSSGSDPISFTLSIS